MNELLFFVEGESDKILVEHLVERLGLNATYQIQVFRFEGKQDLEKRLAKRLKAFCLPEQRIFVLRDQDSHPDCKALKAYLRSLCHDGGRSDATIRIICRELEAWYLGDLTAVEKGFELRGLSRRQNEQKFRDPDRLNSAKQILEQLTQSSPFGRYQERIGTRRISEHLNLDMNRSISFNVFVQSLRQLQCAV